MAGVYSHYGVAGAVPVIDFEENLQLYSEYPAARRGLGR